MDLVIKADGKIGAELTALEYLDGRRIIERFLDTASKADFDHLLLYVKDPGDRRFFAEYGDRYQFSFIDSSYETKDAMLISADLVYHPESLLKALRRKKDPSGCVLWKIAKKEDVEYAQTILNKRNLYPFARYYIVPIARHAANMLAKHFISANSITILSAAFGILVCGIFLFYNDLLVRFSAIPILLWWYLDHVDGYLARIRYQQSKLGAFLDSFLGSLILHGMHLCLALGLFYKTGNAMYLIWGLLYLFGNFMFNTSNLLIAQLKKKNEKRDSGVDIYMKPSGIKRAISFMDDTDFRIHLLAVSALFLFPQASLFYNAVYCNMRWSMNLIYRYFTMKD